MFTLVEALPESFLEKQISSRIQAWRRLGALPLAIELWNGKRFELAPSPKVTLRLNTPRVLKRLEHPSLDSIGEAYVEGELDIEGHIREVISTVSRLVSRVAPDKEKHSGFRIRRHSKQLDAESIRHHYDVSNEFYSLWLDRNMVYSCGYFRNADDSLETAQLQKIDHILHKIQLKPGERLLDIGCGWGALILRATREFGARCTGITLSQRQYEWATQRIHEEKLEDRCEVKLLDYRDVQGRFDKITSVGMFEHVGLANLRDYFIRIHDLLEEGGVVMNHGITSADPDSGETPHGGGRFIDRYVFPNGELPHISLALKEMAAAKLEATDVENLRLHYAKTLDHWTDRFEANSEKIQQIAGNKRYRIWQAYLAGCSFGFKKGWTALHQVVAIKADAATEHPPLPLTREYMYRRCTSVD